MRHLSVAQSGPTIALESMPEFGITPLNISMEGIAANQLKAAQEFRKKVFSKQDLDGKTLGESVENSKKLKEVFTKFKSKISNASFSRTKPINVGRLVSLVGGKPKTPEQLLTAVRKYNKEIGPILSAIHKVAMDVKAGKITEEKARKIIGDDKSELLNAHRKEKHGEVKMVFTKKQMLELADIGIEASEEAIRNKELVVIEGKSIGNEDLSFGQFMMYVLKVLLTLFIIYVTIQIIAVSILVGGAAGALISATVSPIIGLPVAFLIGYLGGNLASLVIGLITKIDWHNADKLIKEEENKE